MNKRNRLSREKSPYLLQHAGNPVDWFPWGEEAFEKAAREDKPVFLSIGYSTCHWCHVMEKESFEDPEVAALMNETFVSVKVDREERPDIDKVYMKVCQLMTGGGGWPLTVIMTPGKEPFFAATYLPKRRRFGRAGMMELIPKVSAAWERNRAQLSQVSQTILSALGGSPSDGSGENASLETLDGAYENMEKRFDPRYGGFGRPPKFPTPQNLMFLLRSWKRNGQTKALEMVAKTLQAMRNGGIYDQVGFGFHRYSTDDEWLVPHFEKMLYDQAMLAMAYIEAYQATGKHEYRVTAEEVSAYVLRDMTSPEGGFYSAEDADSEGEEGKFYVWTEEELKTALGEDDFKAASLLFTTSAGGNFREPGAVHGGGKNILHREKSLSEASVSLGRDERELAVRLEALRGKLFEERGKRIHPLKDDKILTDWNGLMIAAMAKGARVFDNEALAYGAKRASEFLREKMLRPDGKLYHSYKDGKARIDGFLDDYAFFVWGLLELYELTFDASCLETSLKLADRVVERFMDTQRGGFFFTSGEARELLVRTRESFDGAIPSGNSVMFHNLLRLGRMTGNTKYDEIAGKTDRAFAAAIEKAPLGHAHFLSGLSFALGPTREVVIVGHQDAEDTAALLRALRGVYHPNMVVLFKPGKDKLSEEIVKYAPFVRPMTMVDEKATAYVCRNYRCELPTTDVNEMLRLVDVN